MVDQYLYLHPVVENFCLVKDFIVEDDSLLCAFQSRGFLNFYMLVLSVLPIYSFH